MSEPESIATRANRWIVMGRVGISSRSIWAVMMGVIPPGTQQQCLLQPRGFDIPHDTSDFSRCYELLAEIPEWRSRMPEMAERFPKWRPVVEIWEQLTALYEQGEYTAVFQLLRSVYDECRMIDGWEKLPSGAWHLPKTE